MVVLLPLYEGEEIRTCSGCSHLGLASPIRQRSSFGRVYDKYRGRCRTCISSADLARKRRRTKTDPKFLEKKREAQRKYSISERGRTARKRYRKRRIERLGADAVRQEQRVAYRLREERLRGRELREVDESGYQYTGVLLDVGPFKDWLRQLIREEEFEWGDQARARVARNLDIDDSYLGKLLKRRSRVDESVVDNALSRHGGVTIRDIYKPWHMAAVREDGQTTIVRLSSRYTFHEGASEEMPPDEVPAPIAEVETGRGMCKNPKCAEGAGWSVHTKKKQVLGVIEDGGLFCYGHAERLARIRAELEGDGALMAACGGTSKALAKDRKKMPTRPTCCAPGCYQERLSGERFCDSCQAEGWTEESYE